MRAIRKAHKAVQQAVAAEDFDQAELATSLIELRARLGDGQRTSHDDFVNFAKRLNCPGTAGPGPTCYVVRRGLDIIAG